MEKDDGRGFFSGDMAGWIEDVEFEFSLFRFFIDDAIVGLGGLIF